MRGSTGVDTSGTTVVVYYRDCSLASPFVYPSNETEVDARVTHRSRWQREYGCLPRMISVPARFAGLVSSPLDPAPQAPPLAFSSTLSLALTCIYGDCSVKFYNRLSGCSNLSEQPQITRRVQVDSLKEARHPPFGGGRRSID